MATRTTLDLDARDKERGLGTEKKEKMLLQSVSNHADREKYKKQDH